MTGYEVERNNMLMEYSDYICDKYIDDERVDRAIYLLIEKLKGNIEQVEIYYNIAKLYIVNKQYDLAYLFFEQALNYARQNERNEIIDCLNKLKEKEEIQVKPVSIVILTYNNLEYTKQCIESIREHNTLDNYEIIIVDNASTDGTQQWIKELDNVKYILNDKNLGFPKGCNQGIEIAEKENDIFLLNNDTVVMPNSIFNLRVALYQEEKIGATGSVSNKVSYAQQIKESYKTLEEYYTYALNNNVPKMDNNEMRLKLVGFALLIKRAVLNEVGYLEEKFTPGNYEDDDLGLRIIQAGYKNILCKNSFIFHYGSVSFKKEQEKYIKLLNVNKEKFKLKWGFDPGYSLNIRYDIVERISQNSEEPIRVLEVGCACGGTLLAIKNKYKNAELYGLELNESASEIACCLAKVKNGDIEKGEIPFKQEMFDYIIFADVLEHLYNPQNVLEQMQKYLKDKGQIIASIPNVKHISVVGALLKGKWAYQDAGILDWTHLRFFTLTEVNKLFIQAKYNIINIQATSIGLNEKDKNIIENLQILVPGNKDEYIHYQYIVSAQKSEIEQNKEDEEMNRLLDYIEVNNDDDESVEQVLAKMDEEGGLDTIIEGVYSTVIDKVKMLNLLAIKCYESRRYEVILPLLQEALKLRADDFDSLYNMATILALFGEVQLADYYIEQLNETDDVKKRIREEIIV